MEKLIALFIFNLIFLSICYTNSKYKRHMKFSTLSIVVLTFFVLSGCVHIESPHSGVVKDAETRNPIKGVVVHMDLESGMPLGPEGIRKLKGSYETVTDAEGNYSLSIKLKGQLPLELSTGHELSFFKAGYLPSRILEPSLNNSVSLYPIKYYLDYAHYKESAKKGDLDPPFMDKKPEAFTEYKKELIKMATLPFENIGSKGEFISVPNAQFAKISCRTKFGFDDENYSKPYTFGIFGNVCILFDEVSRKMMTFDAQGNIKELKDNLLTKYNFLSAAPDEWNVVFANSDSIYIPHPPYSNMANNVTPQKGHIIALAGDSHEYLTLEDNGLYLCYSSIWDNLGKGCISISDVFSKNDGNAKFILLTHGYSPGQSLVYFVISKNAFQYQIHKITHESDSSGKTNLTFSEQLLPTFPTDDEIIDFASDGRTFFIAFKRGGIKKYSLPLFGKKGPLKEERTFYENSHDLFIDKSIAAVKLGRSVSERVLYVTVGDSTVYRLSLDGVPDFRIRIIEE